MVYGQLNPRKICYMNCWRFWAGNWPQVWFVFSDSGLEKMNKNLVCNGTFPPSESLKKQVNGAMSDWECDAIPLILTALFWFTQLCARIVPILLHAVTNGRPLHESHIVYGMHVTNLCLGSASNCAIRAKQLLPRLQRCVGFEEGECIFIACWSFPSFGSSSKYEVIDLKKGTLLEGTQTLQEALALRRPSDCKDFARKLPLTFATPSLLENRSPNSICTLKQTP